MKPVIRTTLVAICLILASCAGSDSVAVIQKNDRQAQQKQSTKMLTIREKQSLKIAMLKIEYSAKLGGTILLEASSLIYRQNAPEDAKGLKALLPEVVRLLSLAEDRQMTLRVVFEDLATKNLLKELLVMHSLSLKSFKFVQKRSFVNDLGPRPQLILAQSYDQLWPAGLTPWQNVVKEQWFSEWVSLPNFKRDRLTMKEWLDHVQL